MQLTRRQRHQPGLRKLDTIPFTSRAIPNHGGGDGLVGVGVCDVDGCVAGGFAEFAIGVVRDA